MPIMIRPAEEADVSLIVELVNRYAGQDIMLPRTEESVRNTLEDRLVAVEEELTAAAPPILACGALGAAHEYAGRGALVGRTREPAG